MGENTLFSWKWFLFTFLLLLPKCPVVISCDQKWTVKWKWMGTCEGLLGQLLGFLGLEKPYRKWMIFWFINKKRRASMLSQARATFAKRPSFLSTPSLHAQVGWLRSSRDLISRWQIQSCSQLGYVRCFQWMASPSLLTECLMSLPFFLFHLQERLYQASCVQQHLGRRGRSPAPAGGPWPWWEVCVLSWGSLFPEPGPSCSPRTWLRAPSPSWIPPRSAWTILHELDFFLSCWLQEEHLKSLVMERTHMGWGSRVFPCFSLSMGERGAPWTWPASPQQPLTLPLALPMCYIPATGTNPSLPAFTQSLFAA